MLASHPIETTFAATAPARSTNPGVMDTSCVCRILVSAATN